MSRGVVSWRFDFMNWTTVDFVEHSICEQPRVNCENETPKHIQVGNRALVGGIS